MRSLELVLIAALFALAAAPEILLAATSPRDLPREAEMQVFVDELLLMTGLQNDVTVVIDPTALGCAYATTLDGQQYIGVDPACVGPLRTDGKYNHRAVGILAHEVGHLLGGHTTSRKTGHPVETAADEWAGWAMYRLGMSVSEAKVFCEALSMEGSKSHPGRATRIASVERGWNRGKARSIVVQKTVPETQTPTEVAEVREEPLPPTPVPMPAPMPEPEKRPETIERPKRSGWAALLDKPLPWVSSKK